MILSRLRDDDNGKAERMSILRGLPRFCNQLFLMMNAGLILSDAFDTITGSYAGFESGDLSFFEKELAGLSEATDHHRISTAEVINEYAVKHDVKELIRIATILTENEKRGSDVIESLERESRYLWDERKVVARECGKMIDTKMSYPLGLLLIVLIVVTMAPALLNM
jgi:type II secretory pathway component PulF